MGHIVALGGGGFSVSAKVTAIDRFIVSLAAAPRPRVCFVPTASGDSEAYLLKFHRAFAHLDCVVADMPLFRGRPADPVDFLCEQDVVYVGGGNPKAMLELWRAYGWDRALRAASDNGVVLAGVSAGAMCWFDDGLDFDTATGALAPLRAGLGLLAGSCTPHSTADSAGARACAAAVAAGDLPAGYAVGDDAALHFDGEDFAGLVRETPDTNAVRVTRGETGATSTVVTGRLLKEE